MSDFSVRRMFWYGFFRPKSWSDGPIRFDAHSVRDFRHAFSVRFGRAFFNGRKKTPVPAASGDAGPVPGEPGEPIDGRPRDVGRDGGGGGDG